jgi:hypothetical protein
VKDEPDVMLTGDCPALLIVQFTEPELPVKLPFAVAVTE